MNREEKVLLLILAWIQFTHVTDFMLLMPLSPSLIDDLSIDMQAFGLLVSWYTFGAALAVGLSSLFIDRFARKKVLLWAYLGFCLGIVGCYFADSYLALSVSRAINGAFGGICGALIFTIAADAFFSKNGGRQ